MKFSERNDLAAYSWIHRLYERTYNGLRSDLSTDLRIRVEILDPSAINSKDTNLDFTTSKRKDGNTKTDETENFSLKGNDAEVVEIYDFSGCFIDKIDDLELDYSSEEIFEWSLTVQFNEMKVTYPKHAKTNLPEEKDNIETVDVPKKEGRNIDFTTASQIRDEDWLMRIGANGYGGPGGGGKGAGNWNGQEKAGEYGLSATGEKEARNWNGNSPDGSDAHNDNSAKEKSNTSKKPIKVSNIQKIAIENQTGIDWDNATEAERAEAKAKYDKWHQERLDLENAAASKAEAIEMEDAAIQKVEEAVLKNPDILLQLLEQKNEAAIDLLKKGNNRSVDALLIDASIGTFTRFKRLEKYGDAFYLAKNPEARTIRENAIAYFNEIREERLANATEEANK
jgi:hypothetical protein